MHRRGRLAAGTAFVAMLLACASSSSPSPPATDASANCIKECDGKCIDPSTDMAHCGSCGNACVNGAACVQGICQCAASTTKCGSACVDTKTDVNHCGGCNSACGADGGTLTGGGSWACVGGACTVTCSGGKTACGTACVDTKTDDGNCGTCGTACTTVTQHCSDGMCCAVGQLACGGGDGGVPKCIDVQSDVTNCGACGNSCPGGNVCEAGKCIPLYTFQGVKTSFAASALTGWKLCYKDFYTTNNVSLAGTVLAQCTGSQLMLACRQTGSSTILVAAHAPRADVLFDTGTGNVPHVANGTTWYYNGSLSWGFAGLGDAINRNTCDTSSTNASLRLCWHTSASALVSGYRCGAATSLNSSNAYERLIYQAN